MPVAGGPGTSGVVPACGRRVLAAVRCRFDEPPAVWAGLCLDRAPDRRLVTVSPSRVPPSQRRLPAECDAGCLGRQLGVKCVRPCVRVGPGGCRPGCDEPAAAGELVES